MNSVLPALKPLPIKERISVDFVERGEIDMLDGAFVVVDATGVRLYSTGQPGIARSHGCCTGPGSLARCAPRRLISAASSAPDGADHVHPHL